jgi:hypothetical protein
MVEDFWCKAGSLLSPGDLLEEVPYIRTPYPLRIVRKWPQSLPPKYKVHGQLCETFPLGSYSPTPPLNFSPPGEENVSNMKFSRAIFLTWGSEVEGDERSGKLHKKDWLIVPVFPVNDFAGQYLADTVTGEKIDLMEAVITGKSPKYFPLQQLALESDSGYYADFKRICPLPAALFSDRKREWRLGKAALNDFYHHLMWFFTRQKRFFGALNCLACGSEIDLSITFEGQNVEPDKD